MRTVITIKKSDGTSVTIFTSHISHIEHEINGCIIYINGGASSTAINTAYRWEELVIILEKD